jgi:hypothetical protein
MMTVRRPHFAGLEQVDVSSKQLTDEGDIARIIAAVQQLNAAVAALQAGESGEAPALTAVAEKLQLPPGVGLTSRRCLPRAPLLPVIGETAIHSPPHAAFCFGRTSAE